MTEAEIMKEETECRKYYGQYKKACLTGGLTILWCTHSIGLGFHIMRKAEGRNEVFSAIYTHWPVAPKIIGETLGPTPPPSRYILTVKHPSSKVADRRNQSHSAPYSFSRPSVISHNTLSPPYQCPNPRLCPNRYKPRSAPPAQDKAHQA